MSKYKEIKELVLPKVRLPVELKPVIEELKCLEIKGDKIKLFTTSDVVREALVKGLELMLMERAFTYKFMKKKAKEYGERFYGSLVEDMRVKKELKEVFEGMDVEDVEEEELEEEEWEEEEEEE